MPPIALEITHAFEALVAQYGVIALFISVTLEALGAPMPGESAILVAAGAAAAGKLDIWSVGLAAFAGAVLGDNIGYLIGRKLGRPAILRFGGRFGVTESAFAKVEAVIRRRGPIIVVLARFVVLLRQLNGLVAGTTGMHWPTFLVANTIGAALWVGVWATLAYRFGGDVAAILPALWHHLSLVAAVLVPLIVAAFIGARFLGRRHREP